MHLEIKLPGFWCNYFKHMICCAFMNVSWHIWHTRTDAITKDKRRRGMGYRRIPMYGTYLDAIGLNPACIGSAQRCICFTIIILTTYVVPHVIKALWKLGTYAAYFSYVNSIKWLTFTTCLHNCNSSFSGNCYCYILSSGESGQCWRIQEKKILFEYMRKQGRSKLGQSKFKFFKL